MIPKSLHRVKFSQLFKLCHIVEERSRFDQLINLYSNGMFDNTGGHRICATSKGSGANCQFCFAHLSVEARPADK